MDLTNGNLMEMDNFSNFQTKSANLYTKANTTQFARPKTEEYKPVEAKAYNLENQGETEEDAPKSDKFLWMERKTGIAVAVVGVIIVGIGGFMLYKKMKG